MSGSALTGHVSVHSRDHPPASSVSSDRQVRQTPAGATSVFRALVRKTSSMTSFMSPNALDTLAHPRSRLLPC
jgi:hypothetical protein